MLKTRADLRTSLSLQKMWESVFQLLTQRLYKTLVFCIPGLSSNQSKRQYSCSSMLCTRYGPYGCVSPCCVPRFRGRGRDCLTATRLGPAVIGQSNGVGCYTRKQVTVHQADLSWFRLGSNLGSKVGGLGLNPSGQNRCSHTSHIYILEGRNGSSSGWTSRVRASHIGHVGSAQGTALLWWGKEETLLGFVLGRKEFRARPPPWSLSRGCGPWAEGRTIIRRFNHR